MRSFKINKHFLLSTLQDLTRINSKNPTLIDGAPGEMEIAKYIHKLLFKLGIDSTIELVQRARSSVIGILKGKGNGKSLMLNVHMDTVSIQGNASLLEPIMYQDGINANFFDSDFHSKT